MVAYTVTGTTCSVASRGGNSCAATGADDGGRGMYGGITWTGIHDCFTGGQQGKLGETIQQR